MVFCGCVLNVFKLGLTWVKVFLVSFFVLSSCIPCCFTSCFTLKVYFFVSWVLVWLPLFTSLLNICTHVSSDPVSKLCLSFPSCLSVRQCRCPVVFLRTCLLCFAASSCCHALLWCLVMSSCRKHFCLLYGIPTFTVLLVCDKGFCLTTPSWSFLAFGPCTPPE